MSVFAFLKNKKTAGPEQEITELNSALTRVQAELSETNRIVETHGARRSDALLTDVADEEIAKIDADASLARIRAERLEMAEAEILQRLETARDRIERAKTASEREKAARAVEAAAKRIDSIVAQLAAEFPALVEAIPHCCASIYVPARGPVPATPTQIAGAILAEALAARIPGAIETIGAENFGWEVERVLRIYYRRKSDGALSEGFPKNEPAQFVSAVDAAAKIVCEPLRASATNIRAGNAAPNSSVTPLLPKPIIEPPPIGFRAIYLVHPISYINLGGVRVVEEVGNEANLHLPVVEAALAAGAAIELDDTRVEFDKAEWRRNPFEKRQKAGPPIDLGVDLKALQDAERAKLNQPAPRLAAE